MVSLKVGDQNIAFMMDTGAELSVVKKKTCGTTVQKDYRCNWGIGRRDD